jgi:hypothetical protein
VYDGDISFSLAPGHLSFECSVMGNGYKGIKVKGRPSVLEGKEDYAKGSGRVG